MFFIEDYNCLDESISRLWLEPVETESEFFRVLPDKLGHCSVVAEEEVLQDLKIDLAVA
jgi:hypothetical protein